MNKTLLLLATLGSFGALAGPAAAGDHARGHVGAPPSFGIRLSASDPAPKIVRHHHPGAWQLRPQPVFRFADPWPLRQSWRPSPVRHFGHLPPTPQFRHFPPRHHLGHLPAQAPPRAFTAATPGLAQGAALELAPAVAASARSRRAPPPSRPLPGATADGSGTPGRGATSPTGGGSTGQALIGGIAAG